jgi:hypothetical protein
MAPFNAVDGLGFWVGTTPYYLSAGRYGSGEGAVVVHAIDGQVETKLTVSLANYGAPPLEVGELWVKLANNTFDSTTAILQAALLELGVFEFTGDTVAQGQVEKYAARWRFARCKTDGHEGVEIDYTVECRDCKARIRKAYEAGKVRLLARDSVRMIKRMGRADQW